MGQTTCPECHCQFSNAAKCPQCGHAVVTNPPPRRQNEPVTASLVAVDTPTGNPDVDAPKEAQFGPKVRCAFGSLANELGEVSKATIAQTSRLLSFGRAWWKARGRDETGDSTQPHEVETLRASLLPSDDLTRHRVATGYAIAGLGAFLVIAIAGLGAFLVIYSLGLLVPLVRLVLVVALIAASIVTAIAVVKMVRSKRRTVPPPIPSQIARYRNTCLIGGVGVVVSVLILAALPSDKPSEQTAGGGEESPALEVEAIVSLVLGKQIGGYDKNGFKDVEFGTPHAQIKSDKNLKWVNRDNPCRFLDSQDAKQASTYIFDSDKRLIMYAQSYVGTPADYVESLTETFGKTNQEIKTKKFTSRNSVTTRSTVSYHFPKVYVRTILVESKQALYTGIMTTGVTHVIVTDREWLKSQLEETVSLRWKRFEWLRLVADLIDRKAVSKDQLPSIPNCKIVDLNETTPNIGFHFVDSGKYDFYETIDKKFDSRLRADASRRQIMFNEAAKREQQRPAIVAGVRHVSNGGFQNSKQPFWNVYYDFQVNTADAVTGVHRQEQYRKKHEKCILENTSRLRVTPLGNIEWSTGTNALSVTPLGDLLTEVNSFLAQAFFPPKDGLIDRAESNSGYFYYKWKTDLGWTVTCSSDDVVSLTRQKQPQL